MTRDGLGVCTAERACIARFRSGVDQVCLWHSDLFDPRHAAQVDNGREMLGERLSLTLPEAEILADRERDAVDAVA